MNDKKFFWTFIIGFVIILTGAIAYSSGFFSDGVGKNLVSAQSNPQPSASATGDVQIVKLKVNRGEYIMTPSTIKKGIPVRIEADMSQMPGCSRSVFISAFGVRKSLSSSNNIIEFTPDKTGTFNIACSMNMYRGTFTVVD